MDDHASGWLRECVRVLDLIARNALLMTNGNSLHRLSEEGLVHEHADVLIVNWLVHQQCALVAWGEVHDWAEEFCEHCGGTLFPVRLTEDGRAFLDDLLGD